MPEISNDEILRIVGSALSNSSSVALQSDGTDQLSRLGIDSLSILNILITAAEEFGLDIARLDETMPIPVTVNDVAAILRGLPAV